MARKWGSADYRQLQKLQANLQKLQSVDLDKFCQEVSKELAARLLALVIPRTPVGKYPKSSGKKGGTLRRGWTGNQTASSGRNYAKALPIIKQGNVYRVEIINPVHYASYVEFGHRTADHKGWVKGQYFLTLSEQDLKDLAPGIIERKLQQRLQEVFRV